MKREELEIGTEYAVLSPSQRNKVDSWGYAPRARRVRVVATEAVWYGSASDWGNGYGWRREPRPGKVVVAGIGTFAWEDDFTHRLDEGLSSGSYYQKDASRSVLVLETKRYGDGFVLTTVPLANVAMKWSEFTSRQQAAKFRHQAAVEDEARRRADAEKQATAIRGQLEALRELAGEWNIQLNLYQGKATIDFADLRRLLELAGEVAR